MGIDDLEFWAEAREEEKERGMMWAKIIEPNAMRRFEAPLEEKLSRNISHE
jgi:siroheme synthase (precorrin-2 oxidase/ferrochelatase)